MVQAVHLWLDRYLFVVRRFIVATFKTLFTCRKSAKFENRRMAVAPCSQLSAAMKCSINSILPSAEKSSLSLHGTRGSFIRGSEPRLAIPPLLRTRRPAKASATCASSAPNAHGPAFSSFSPLERSRMGSFLPKPAPLAGCQQRNRAAVVCQSAAGGQAIGSGAQSNSRAASIYQKVGNFVQSQFLPLGLVVGIISGYLWPKYGTLAAQQALHRVATIGIFIISGLCLSPQQVMKTLDEWQAIIYSCASIWFLTPLAAFLVLKLPLLPREFPMGLALFSCMPTTLSTAVALSATVGANAPLALAVTLLSNLGGIFTMPFVIAKTVGAGLPVALEPIPLLIQLLQCILVPLICAMAARAYIPGVSSWVDKNRKPLSYINSLLLISVPWMQVSASSKVISRVQPQALFAVTVIGTLLHVLFLIVNNFASHMLHLGWHEYRVAHGKGEETHGEHSSPEYITAVHRAVVLVSSEKTLPVCVAVIQGLKGALGDSGLLVLGCIAAHLSQIIFDSALVSFWMKRDASEKASHAQ
eukprot:jgi/Mesvir1/29208/Mv08626-RA.1